NLLDNAHRFAKTRVSVSAQSDDQGLLVSIRDDGPGFNAPSPRLAASAIDESQKQQGLGLTIAQEIVSAYRGNLTFEANDAAGALTVNIRLPCPLHRGARPGTPPPNTTAVVRPPAAPCGCVAPPRRDRRPR